MFGIDWWNVRRMAAMLLLCMVGLSGRAFAQTDLVPNVPSDQPAASLLLPYFEVNLDDTSAQNTLMSITNTSATAILAHVILWSDLSVHTLDFDVYLTGYDVWRINLSNLLVFGIAGQSTASAGQDPTDTISPKGPRSQDINFASCQSFLPLPPVPAFQLVTTQLALTGQSVPGFGNKCAALDHGDRIARGYITIDTVSQCSVEAPGDPDYFNGIVTNQNVLTGDSFYINKRTNQAVAQNLVALPASTTNPLTTTAGNYTFYGRYTGTIPTAGWTAADHRYPTSTSFQARYIQGTSTQGQNFFTNGSSMIVWRDSKVDQNPFICPVTIGHPSWFPLGQEGITIFNENEQVVTPASCHFSPCPISEGLLPFPAETQKVKVGGAALPIPFLNGWLYLDLNTSVAEPPATKGLTDDAAAQAWVITLFDNGLPNLYEIGERAFQFDSATKANHFVP
jgi:hypothetical protein